jgi:hypothetical protein
MAWPVALSLTCGACAELGAVLEAEVDAAAALVV